MPRLWIGCSSISCISRRKRKTFAINEEHQKPETRKASKQRAETVRMISSSIATDDKPKKTNSKRTLKSACDDTIFDAKTNISTRKTKSQTCKDKMSRNLQTPLAELFRKAKGFPTPSPLPLNIDNFSESNYDETTGSTTSDWSTSTSNDSNENVKVSKHRSCAESYDLTKQTASHKKSTTQSTHGTDDDQSSEKSKSVSKNDRKKTVKD